MIKIIKQIGCISLLLITLVGCGIFNSEKPWVEPAPLPKVSNAHVLKQVWKQQVGSTRVDLSLSPAYSNDRLFVVDGNRQITALNAKSGKVVWQQKQEHDLSTAVATNGQVVVVGSADGFVIAVQQATGALLWQTNIGNQMLAIPTLTKDKVLVKTINGDVKALNLHSGKPIWSYHHDEPVLILRRASQVKVLEDKAIAGFADGQLAVLNLSDGKVVWQRPLAEHLGLADVEQMIDVDADPIVTEDRIIAATYQGQIVSVSPSTGHTLWQKPMSTYTGLALNNGEVYVTNADSDVQAFAVTNGESLWDQKLLAYRDLTAPTSFKDFILVGDGQGYIHVLQSKDGKPVSYTQLDDAPILAPPVIVADSIYVITNTGQVAAYNLS